MSAAAGGDLTAGAAASLHAGDVGIVAFNRGNTSVPATVTWEMAGLQPAQKATVRDLWLHKDLGVHTGSITSQVQPHAVWAVRLVPSKLL